MSQQSPCLDVINIKSSYPMLYVKCVTVRELFRPCQVRHFERLMNIHLGKGNGLQSTYTNLRAIKYSAILSMIS